MGDDAQRKDRAGSVEPLPALPPPAGSQNPRDPWRWMVLRERAYTSPIWYTPSR